MSGGRKDENPESPMRNLPLLRWTGHRRNRTLSRVHAHDERHRAIDSHAGSDFLGANAAIVLDHVGLISQHA